MGDVISFNILRSDGGLNPTAASQRFKYEFWDPDDQVWRKKQTPGWDGGWRWFQSEVAAVLVIYNTCNVRCFYEITELWLEDTLLEPELVFEIAKCHVALDINVEAIKERLAREFRQMADAAWGVQFPDVRRSTWVRLVRR